MGYETMTVKELRKEISRRKLSSEAKPQHKKKELIQILKTGKNPWRVPVKLW